jgi:hypothetical protein
VLVPLDVKVGDRVLFGKYALGYPGDKRHSRYRSPEHMRDNVRAGFGEMPDRPLRQRMVEELGS